MYGTPQKEGTVTSSAQNIATSTLGTNTSSSGDKNTDSSYDTTQTNLPVQQQTSETGRTLPGMLMSRLKEEDDVSCLSIKSGKLGPYAGGADTPPAGQTGTTTEQSADKSTTERVKEMIGLGSSQETSTTGTSATE